jgi:hypothetical protein
VLGADVVVAELQRLAQRQLEHLLGARREGDVARRRRATLADDLLDLAAHCLQGDAERLERLGGDALTLVDEAEQDVLGTDVVVVEQARLFLGQHDHPTGPVGESFEHLDASLRTGFVVGVYRRGSPHGGSGTPRGGPHQWRTSGGPEPGCLTRWGPSLRLAWRWPTNPLLALPHVDTMTGARVEEELSDAVIRPTEA